LGTVEHGIWKKEKGKRSHCCPGIFWIEAILFFIGEALVRRKITGHT
jgi:hypothetical protein